MSLTGLRRCHIEAQPAVWPALQVWAAFPPRQPGATPAQQRRAAQAFVRQALQQLAGAELAAAAAELPAAARGAQAWSFSHEAEASLLAWCPRGEAGASAAIGVDLLDLDSLAQTSPKDLADTAALYLGPECAADLSAQPSHAHLRFAQAWIRHEARLKCLGLGLEEWQPALAQRLCGIDVAKVLVPDGEGRGLARWVGAVAWRLR